MKDAPRTPLEALKALVSKIRIIESNEQYKALWVLAAAHSFHYDGPDWERELQQARDVLVEWEEDTTLS